MADNNVIGILFGVAGEGNISGESGRLIQTQLKQIADKVNLQIKLNINKNHFKEQLKSLRSEVEREFGTAISSSVNNSTARSGSSGGGAKKASAEYSSLIKLVNQYRDAIKKSTSDISGSTAEHKNNVKAVSDAYAKMQTAIEAANSSGKISTEEYNNLQSLKTEYQELGAQIAKVTQARREDKLASLESQSDKLFAKASGLKERYSDLIKSNSAAQELYDTLERVGQSYQIALNSGNYGEASKAQKAFIEQLAQTQAGLSELTYQSDTLGAKFAETFKNKIVQGMVYALIGLATNALRKVYDNVVNIDTAMGQLRIVTRRTADEYKDFSKTITETAKKIGASVNDLIDSTTVYARLGYSLQDAATLAEKTTMYSKVGDVGIGDATSNITAIIKAFGIEASGLESVIDQLIYVGNNYAISSAELGEGMNNAASALAANGNTLTEAMGILTAAQVTLQNASKSSTAVRTIAARIAQSKVELEELGEDTEGVLATAALDEKMRAFGVAVVDANGNLRSTYDILSDLSKGWDRLNNTERAAIANMLAGTRQQNAFYSIMQNWQDAEEIVNNASDGYGALQTAQDTYLNTIQGRTEQLKAAWEDFSTTVLSSDFVSRIIEGLTSIASILTKIVDGVGATPIIVAGLSVAVAVLLPYISKWLQQIIQYATQLKSVLSTGSIITVILTIIGLLSNLGGTAGKIISVVVLGITLIFTTLIAFVKAADAAVTATGFGAILKIIAVIVSMLAVFIELIVSLAKQGKEKQANLKKSLEETSKALQEQADAFREVADAAKEASDSIDSLIKDYKELGDSATAGQWNDTLMGIGAEVIDLFPNDTLSEIAAINKLLGTTYSYSELIAMTDMQRAELMRKIADAARDRSKQAAREYYDSQKNASASTSRASGVFTMTEEDWEAAGKSDAYARRMTKEAKKILEDAGISSKRRDAGRQIDFTIDLGSPQENIKKIKEAMAKYEEEYSGHTRDLEENYIYQKLKTALSESEEALSKTANAASKLLNASTASIAKDILIDTSAANAKEEFDRVVDAFKTALEKDGDVQQLLKDGIIDSATQEQSIYDFIAQNYTDFYNKANGIVAKVNASLKSTTDILNDLEDSFDSLKSAMDDMNEIGIVSASTLKKLTELGLLEYVEKTADGYKVLDNAISSYIEKQIESYKQSIINAQAYYESVSSAYEKSDEKTISDYKDVVAAQETLKNTITNAENLLVTIAVMEREDLLDQYTELLEKQQDALEEEIDKQKELADLRKDILSTYQDQVKYQKQLEKKQTKVSVLQTELALAKLDTSSAGQARAKELANNLQDAQDDLDDFTLENAIDTIQSSIESEVNEYENFIQQRIEEIKTTIEDAAKMSNEGLKTNIEALGGTIATAVSERVRNELNDAMGSGSNSANGSISAPNVGENSSSTSEPEDNSVTRIKGWGNDKKAHAVGSNIRLQYKNKSYDIRYARYANNDEWSQLSDMPADSLRVINGDLFYRRPGGGNAIYKLGATTAAGWDTDDINELKTLIESLPNQRTYHSGGFVGDLHTNEEYAKLLKGEFVATPKQMDDFISNTLPNLINYSNASGSVVIDSPLVKIECENVNDNTLPMLEDLAKRAANIVANKMDESLSRSGYKKTHK